MRPPATRGSLFRASGGVAVGACALPAARAQSPPSTGPLLGLSTSRGPRDHGTAGPHPVHGTATGQPRDTTGQHFFPKKNAKKTNKGPKQHPKPAQSARGPRGSSFRPPGAAFLAAPRDTTGRHKMRPVRLGRLHDGPRGLRAAPGWLDAGERRGAPPPSLAKCKIAAVYRQTRTWRHQFCMHARRQRGISPWRQFRCQSVAEVEALGVRAR